jgi:gluconolactonase
MIFTEDILNPEGPVLLADGSWLVVEMNPDRGCITHISADGRNKRRIAKTGVPNGLTIDRQEIIWVADTKQQALLRLDMEGNWDVFLNACDGEPFVFPNDLVFGADGALYLTDSGITDDEIAPGGEIRPDYDKIPVSGRLYRIDVQTREIRKIDEGIRYPNGLVFGPDGELYVNETITGNVYRYRTENGRVVDGRRYFGNVIDKEAGVGFKGPDGMKFGQDGNLYVTVFGQRGVTVLGRDGTVVKQVPTEGKNPTNCAFGPAGSKELYVTELEYGRMEVLEVGVDGYPLYKGN